MHHQPTEATSQETFLADLDRQVKEAHETDGFTEVLKLAENRIRDLDSEFAFLTAGAPLRWMTNQEREELRRHWTPEKALLNQQLEDLDRKRRQWTYVAEHSREFAANEEHGWTIMPDGTPAKVLDNGQVLSSYGGVRYEEDDGTIVDTSTRDEQWQRRHRRHVRKLGQRVRDERLQKARNRRPPIRPHARLRLPRTREHRPAATRRAASSSTTASADPPGDPEPSWLSCPVCGQPLHTDRNGADHCGGCGVTWWEGLR